MKRCVLLFFVILLAATVCAQQPTQPAPSGAPPAGQTPPSGPPPAAPAAQMPAAKPQDVDSIDHILAAVYDAISGPAGQARDWERFRSLFIPEARLIPNSVRLDGSIVHTVLSVDDYVTRASRGLAQQGFFESETARSAQVYGQIAQVFSTYESKREKAGPAFAHGINSFQLLNDGKRWYVVTIMWQGETAQAPIPPEYQKKP